MTLSRNNFFRRHLSFLATRLAVVAIIGLMGSAAPLHAAERSYARPSPLTPLEMARKLESLTEGGPFNPARANAIGAQRSQDQDGQGGTHPPATSLCHNLW